MFCNRDPFDFGFAIKVLTEKGLAELEIFEKLAMRLTQPKELVKLIASYKSLISFRLHSHIIAY